MLDSLQLHLKLILFLFIGIFFISLTFALELGMSPPILNFKGEGGNEICREFKIFSNREGLSLRLDDKWTNKNSFSKDIKDYSYNREKFGIEMEYYSRVVVDREYVGEICIKAKNEGIYYGLLSVNSENGNVGLGSWMVVDVGDESKRIKLDKSISGLVLGENFYAGFFNILPFILLISMVFLCLILLFLMSRLNSK